MIFAFSVEDVKKFINGIDSMAAEVVDEKIRSIEALVGNFNISIEQKIELVSGFISEEKMKLPVLREKFEKAKMELQRAKDALKSCPLAIWIPKNDIHGKPDGQMPIPNPAYADCEADIKESEAKLKKAEWELQSAEEKIAEGNNIINDCSKLIIKVDISDFVLIKKQMEYKLMLVERKAKKVISYGEEILSFSFSYNPDSKKYNLRIK